jgi:hypothetical protein
MGWIFENLILFGIDSITIIFFFELIGVKLFGKGIMEKNSNYLLLFERIPIY